MASLRRAGHTSYDFSKNAPRGESDVTSMPTDGSGRIDVRRKTELAVSSDRERGCMCHRDDRMATSCHTCTCVEKALDFAKISRRFALLSARFDSISASLDGFSSSFRHACRSCCRHRSIRSTRPTRSNVLDDIREYKFQAATRFRPGAGLGARLLPCRPRLGIIEADHSLTGGMR